MYLKHQYDCQETKEEALDFAHFICSLPVEGQGQEADESSAGGVVAATAHATAHGASAHAPGALSSPVGAYESCL